MDIWIKDSKCYTVAGEIVDVRTLNVTFSTQCQVGDARVLPQGMLAHSTRLPPFRQRWTSERQQNFHAFKRIFLASFYYLFNCQRTFLV